MDSKKMPTPPPNPIVSRQHDGGIVHGPNGPMPVALHPEAAKAAAIFSDTMNENQELRAKLNDVLNENKLLRSRLREMEHEVDHERGLKERFQRYAVTADTLIEAITRAAQQARDASRAASMEQERKAPPPAPHKPVSEIESEVDHIVQSMNARP